MQPILDREMYSRRDPGMGQPSTGWAPFCQVFEKLVSIPHSILTLLVMCGLRAAAYKKLLHQRLVVPQKLREQRIVQYPDPRDEFSNLSRSFSAWLCSSWTAWSRRMRRWVPQAVRTQKSCLKHTRVHGSTSCFQSLKDAAWKHQWGVEPKPLLPAEQIQRSIQPLRVASSRGFKSSKDGDSHFNDEESFP